MILSVEQKKHVNELLDNRYTGDIESKDVNILLDELDSLVYSLLDKNYEPTDESRKVEWLMDEIYWDNTH